MFGFSIFVGKIVIIGASSEEDAKQRIEIIFKLLKKYKAE